MDGRVVGFGEGMSRGQSVEWRDWRVVRREEVWVGRGETGRKSVWFWDFVVSVEEKVRK